MKEDVDAEQLDLAIKKVVSSRKSRVSSRDRGWQRALPKLIASKLSVPEMVAVLLSLNFEVTDSGLYKWLNRNMPDDIAYLRRRKRKNVMQPTSNQAKTDQPVVDKSVVIDPERKVSGGSNQDGLSVKERIAMGASATLERIGTLVQDKKD